MQTLVLTPRSGKINIADGVSHIERITADSCDGIIIIPNSVVNIDQCCFYTAHDIRVYIPSNVTSIGREFFDLGQDGDFVYPEDVHYTIYCDKGSYAEIYAKQYCGNVDYMEYKYYCPTTDGLKISSPNVSSFNCSWDASQNADGYEISYSTSLNGNFITKDVGNVTSYKLSGLKENTKYYMRVRAYVNNPDGKGYAEYSDTLSISTLLGGAWKKDAKGWWYRYSNGTYPKNCWKQISGAYYHFNTSGYMQTGWLKLNNKWYYLNSSGARQSGWKTIGKIKYYFDQNGIMKTGWIQLSNKWYYLNSSGALAANKWIGKYYVDSAGVMVKGWKKLSGQWYYFDSAGARVSGWKTISGKKYYFDSKGIMKTGWQTISGKKYYMDSSGAMQTSWLKKDGKWYYLKKDGTMAIGWMKVSGKYYYMNSSGVMQASKWIGNYYLTGSGAMAVNTWIGKYYVGADGKWIPNYKKTAVSS